MSKKYEEEDIVIDDYDAIELSCFKKISDKEFKSFRNDPKAYLENYAWIGNQAFCDLSRRNLKKIKNLVIPKTIRETDCWAFSGCYYLENVIFEEGFKYAGKGTFAGCLRLKTVVFPVSFEFMEDRIFNNCISLKSVKFLNPNTRFDTYLSDFHYAYLDASGALTFSNELPNNSSEYTEVIDIRNIEQYYYEKRIKINSLDELRFYNKFADILKQTKMKISSAFLERLLKITNSKNFMYNSTFKFLSNELKSTFETFNSKWVDRIVKESFFNLAYVLGCFRKDNLKDKHGNLTQVKIAQKASSLLKKIVDDYIPVVNFPKFFIDLPLTDFDQDLLDFLCVTDKGNYVNLDLLLNLHKNNPDIFCFVSSNFKLIKLNRKTINDVGMPTTVPWKTAILKCYKKFRYYGITAENEDIAELFSKHNLDQNIFKEASRLRKVAIENNVPHHILNFPLKEKTAKELAEEAKNNVATLIQNSSKNLKQAFENNFTYEFLDKYDPINAIIGLYCDCCATITSLAYGRSIAQATIISPDVQNIVIQNAKNQIVAKCAIYINEKYGYGVINDFQVHNEFNDKFSKKQILKAFLRSINDFVAEYDKCHPDNPIKRINVGLGYNDLEKEIENFQVAKNNLFVPEEYKFNDCYVQRILYDHAQNNKGEDNKL